MAGAASWPSPRPPRSPGPRARPLPPPTERPEDAASPRAPARAAPPGGGSRLRPSLLPGGPPPGEDPPHVPASTRVVGGVRADERRPGDASRLSRLVVHAHVVGREVEEPGAW